MVSPHPCPRTQQPWTQQPPSVPTLPRPQAQPPPRGRRAACSSQAPVVRCSRRRPPSAAATVPCRRRRRRPPQQPATAATTVRRSRCRRRIPQQPAAAAGFRGSLQPPPPCFFLPFDVFWSRWFSRVGTANQQTSASVKRPGRSGSKPLWGPGLRVHLGWVRAGPRFLEPTNRARGGSPPHLPLKMYRTFSGAGEEVIRP